MRYLGLDWARFVLAVLAVFSHIGFGLWDYMGFWAVHGFFVISGFLIGGMLLKMAPADLPRFYFNRAVRIGIPYAVALVLVYGYMATREPIDAAYRYDLLADVTFTNNWLLWGTGEPMLPGNANGPFWSIAVEEQFYLAAPLILTVATFGRSIWFLSAVFAGLVALEQSPFAAIVAGVMLARMGVPWPRGRVGAVARFAGGLSYPLYLNHWMGAFIVIAVTNAQGWQLPSVPLRLSFLAVSLAIAAALYLAIDVPIRQNRDQWWRALLAVVTKQPS